jgi:hypothetical protein
MKCPHCLVSFHDTSRAMDIGPDADGRWAIVISQCPSCRKFILTLRQGEDVRAPNSPHNVMGKVKSEILIRPRGTLRPPCPPEVPSGLCGDYLEACLVLADSTKAAAALGRRCLQCLLRDHANVKAGDLANEIQQVLDSGNLPSHLAQSIDAIRNVGNFAAHPLKSTQSGLILDVEPGEAEWTLEVLESLFDFYFVRPAITKRKRDELNKKLEAAGKPPMK